MGNARQDQQEKDDGMTALWQAFVVGLGFWLALAVVLPVISLVAFVLHEIERRWGK